MDTRPREEAAVDGGDGLDNRAVRAAEFEADTNAQIAEINPACAAAAAGDTEALRSLPREALSVADADGVTAAHHAATRGQKGCLWVLHELGVSLAVAAHIVGLNTRPGSYFMKSEIIARSCAP
jgi:hypothetical protein